MPIEIPPSESGDVGDTFPVVDPESGSPVTSSTPSQDTIGGADLLTDDFFSTISQILNLSSPRISMGEWFQIVNEKRDELTHEFNDVNFQDPAQNTKFHEASIQLHITLLDILTDVLMSYISNNKNYEQIEAKRNELVTETDDYNTLIGQLNTEITSLNANDPAATYNAKLAQARAALAGGTPWSTVASFYNNAANEYNDAIAGYNDLATENNTVQGPAYTTAVGNYLNEYTVGNQKIDADNIKWKAEGNVGVIPHKEIPTINPNPIPNQPLYPEAPLVNPLTPSSLPGNIISPTLQTTPIPPIEQPAALVPNSLDTFLTELFFAAAAITLFFNHNLDEFTFRFDVESLLKNLLSLKAGKITETEFIANFIESATKSDSSSAIASVVLGLSNRSLERILATVLLNSLANRFLLNNNITNPLTFGGFLTNALVRDLVKASILAANPSPFLFSNPFQSLNDNAIQAAIALNVAVSIVFGGTSGILAATLRQELGRAGAFLALSLTDQNNLVSLLTAVTALNLFGVASSLAGRLLQNPALFLNALAVGLAFGLPSSLLNNVFFALQIGALSATNRALVLGNLQNAFSLVFLNAGLGLNQSQTLALALAEAILRPDSSVNEVIRQTLLDNFGAVDPTLLNRLLTTTSLALALVAFGGLNPFAALTGLSQNDAENAVRNALLSAGADAVSAQGAATAVAGVLFGLLTSDLSPLERLIVLENALLGAFGNFGIDNSLSREVLVNIITELGYAQAIAQLGEIAGEGVDTSVLEQQIRALFDQKAAILRDLFGVIAELNDPEQTSLLLNSFKDLIEELGDLNVSLEKLLEPGTLMAGIMTQGVDETGSGVNLMPSGGERGSIDIQV